MIHGYRNPPDNLSPPKNTGLTSAMIARADIQAFVNDVVRKFRPSRVILFGSYAYGQPNDDSDVDLMVVLPHRGSSVKIATRIRLECPRSFPMDLMVRSPAEIRRRIKLGDPFLTELTSKGVVLQETNPPFTGPELNHQHRRPVYRRSYSPA